jgi:hypothetical protein
MGPMTGRGAGYCSGSAVPGYMNSYGGRGFGRGFGYGAGFGRGGGFGRGWGRSLAYGVPAYPYPVGTAAAPFPYTAAAPSPEVERLNLKNQAEYLEEELKSIRKRLTDLEKTEEQ